MTCFRSYENLTLEWLIRFLTEQYKNLFFCCENFRSLVMQKYQNLLKPYSLPFVFWHSDRIGLMLWSFLYKYDQ